jgi:nucleoside-diphosphate-sugar epimerase
LRVLVTGASGFIGSQLVPGLRDSGLETVAACRSPLGIRGVEWRRAPDLGPGADWSHVLRGADAVVHLAGRAHVLRGPDDEDSLYRRVNTEGTRRLARQAREAGARQFVFLSSCQAIAAESDEVLTRSTPAGPESAYGRSKLAAEQAVREELENGACAWTILRPPLVYGPGNKANFARLIRLVRSGFPLPLAKVRNRRSFVGVNNLVNFVIHGCLGNEPARNRIFYPADEPDLSTPELLKLLADGMDRRICLFRLPPSFLQALGRLPGLDALRKLRASLFVDTTPNRRELDWVPPHSTSNSLRELFHPAS